MNSKPILSVVIPTVGRPSLLRTVQSLLAAKEQIVICGSTIDEHIAGRVLIDRERILPQRGNQRADLRVQPVLA